MRVPPLPACPRAWRGKHSPGNVCRPLRCRKRQYLRAGLLALRAVPGAVALASPPAPYRCSGASGSVRANAVQCAR
jgi:hypothetical protein